MKRVLNGPQDVAGLEKSTLSSDFQSAMDHRGDHVVQLTHPKSDFKGDALLNAMGGQRQQVDNILNGTQLSQYYPFTTGNILEQFRLYKAPGFPLQSNLPQSQLTANFTHPMARCVMPYDGRTDACSKHEIVFLCKVPLPGNFKQPRVSGRLMEPPVKLVNTVALNEILFKMQLKDFKKDPFLYRTRDAFYYWRDWCVDGIVESEEMLDGSESNNSSGYPPNRNMPMAAEGFKMTTVTTMGKQKLYNSFGQNIRQGGTCHMIMKKHTMPTEFNISNKLNLTNIMGRHKVDVPQSKSDAFRPYLISYVCLPRGGIMPREALYYYDEDGLLRKDALRVKLGTIFSTPYLHRYKECNNYYDKKPLLPTNEMVSNDPGAFVDANVGTGRGEDVTLMELLLCSTDGICPLSG